MRTANVESMVAFYCNILGCTVEKVQEEFCLTQLRVGENLIDLVQVNFQAQDSKGNLEHFCLRINPFNYDSLKIYFAEKGIVISRYGYRYGAKGYGWSFYLKDPDGNEIELTGVNDCCSA